MLKVLEVYSACVHSLLVFFGDFSSGVLDVGGFSYGHSLVRRTFLLLGRAFMRCLVC